MKRVEQQLIDEELFETTERLQAWVDRELKAPVPMGHGRNNQMIRLAPRMRELGLDESDIFVAFKEMYGLDGIDDKDPEIWAVIRSSARYASCIAPQDPSIEKEKRRIAAEIQRQAIANMKTVMTEYRWPESEIRRSGGCEGWSPCEQREAFIRTMFQPSDVMWIGQVHHSGLDKHARNFKTREQWLATTPFPAFEFVSHCTFKPGTISRCNEAVVEHRYLVVESDELSRDEIGAVFSWLAAGGIVLRAVVFSGGRSLHGWFEWPENVDAVKQELAGLRCDPSTLRASQPVRLAGQKRKDTQKIQELLYLTQ